LEFVPKKWIWLKAWRCPVSEFLKLTRITMAAAVLAVAFSATPAAAQQSPGIAVTDTSPAGELTYWNGIKDTSDVLNFKAYLENFPNGMFYDLALAKYNSLGGSVTDLKPIAKDSVTPANSGNAKPKLVLTKKKPSVVARKKVASNKIKKKPRKHVVKKVASKYTVAHPKVIKKRKKILNRPDGSGGGGGGWHS
jgi:hypothetical protein